MAFSQYLHACQQEIVLLSLSRFYFSAHARASHFIHSNFLFDRLHCKGRMPVKFRGGGGYFHNLCMRIGYVPRKRPPFSALNFRSGAYNFHKISKKIRSGASPFYIFFGGFCRSGDHHFQNFFKGIQPVHRLPWPAQPERKAFSRSKRIKLVPEPHIFTLKRLKLVPEPHIFTLDRKLVPEPCPFFTLPRHIPTKIWGEYPPPPPPGGKIIYTVAP